MPSHEGPDRGTLVTADVAYRASSRVAVNLRSALRHPGRGANIADSVRGFDEPAAAQGGVPAHSGCLSVVVRGGLDWHAARHARPRRKPTLPSKTAAPCNATASRLSRFSPASSSVMVAEHEPVARRVDAPTPQLGRQEAAYRSFSAAKTAGRHYFHVIGR